MGDCRRHGRARLVLSVLSSSCSQRPLRDEPGPFDLLKAALDELVEAGILEPARRPTVEYPIWATVHGLAVLFRGPLRYLPDRDKSRIEVQTLAFIEASLSRTAEA